MSAHNFFLKQDLQNNHWVGHFSMKPIYDQSLKNKNKTTTIKN